MGKLDLLNGSAKGPIQKVGASPKPVWKAAKDLKLGDKEILKDGSTGTVTALEPVKELQTVYNFSVEEDHTYFVSEMGVLVHNQYKVRELVEQAKLSPTEVKRAEALQKTLTAGTENLSPEEANRVVSKRTTKYLEENNLTENDIISGGTTQGAIISAAIYNGMNLNSLRGTGISLQKAHRLLIDTEYRNIEVRAVLSDDNNVDALKRSLDTLSQMPNSPEFQALRAQYLRELKQAVLLENSSIST